VTDDAATAALVAGYVAAVPLTLFTPGFLRLWRRREPWAFATAQGGALLIVAGWAAKGNVPSAAAERRLAGRVRGGLRGRGPQARPRRR
jgi:hypothetical protein